MTRKEQYTRMAEIVKAHKSGKSIEAVAVEFNVSGNHVRWCVKRSVSQKGRGKS